MTEQLVNTFTFYDQSSPVIASLSDGGWVTVWQSRNQDGDASASYSIHQQRFDAAGNPVGSETFVSTNYTTGDQVQPSVIGLADGGWVVGWTTPDNAGLGNEIYTQRYKANGDLFGVPQNVNSYHQSNQIWSNICALSDGGYVVAWNSFGQDGSGSGVYMRKYNADGSSIASDLPITGNTDGNQMYPKILSTQDGWFAFWLSSGGGNGLNFQKFDLSGKAVGLEKNVVANNVFDPEASDFTSVNELVDGSFLAVWTDQGSASYFRDIAFKHIGADGSVPNLATIANSDTQATKVAPCALGLADGGWMILWESRGQDYFDSSAADNAGIYQQRYDANGHKIGGELRVNQIVEGDQRAPKATLLNDGGYVVTWSSDTKNPSNVVDIHQRRFGTDITGSDADDTLNGTAKDEWLIGGDGKDVLDGKGGDDIMAGGAGDDTYYANTLDDQITELKGEGYDTIIASLSYSLEKVQNVEKLMLSTLAGAASLTGSSVRDVLVGNGSVNKIMGLAGDDWLDGGAGADTLNGGIGNDTYVIDNAKDVIQEQIGPGQGTDTVRSPFDYSIASNLALENITLTGKAVKATGNSLANVLTGNGLANVLQGGSGADTMKGGAGNDRYYVDNTKDIVTEAKASGSDTVYSKIGWTLGANLEKLVLQGTADLNGKGNALGNTLTGTTGKNTLNGLGGNDTLNGGGGADHLFGGADKDVLNGGAGNDILSGGGAADRFVFSGKFGHDTIGDFKTGQDHIDVRSIAAVKNFDYLHDHMQEKNGDVIIKLGANWITLENHHIKDFDAHDFMI